MCLSGTVSVCVCVCFGYGGTRVSVFVSRDNTLYYRRALQFQWATHRHINTTNLHY